MTDLIERQAAIDAIEEMQIPIMRSRFIEEQFVFRGMSESLQAIKNLPSAQPEQRWIPCSERLPEPQTEVVVSFDNGEVKILWQNWADPSSLSNYPGEPLAYICGDGIPHTFEEWESMKTYAVAWMPLPEPYKGEA